MSNPDKIFNEAVRLHESGFLHEAIILYRSLLSSHGTNPHLNFMLGMAYVQSHQYTIGIQHLDAVLSLCPDDIGALTNRGIALRKLGQAEDAVRNFDQALAIKPDIASIYSNRGNALKDLKKTEEAHASYIRALDLDCNNLDALVNLGALLNDLNRPKDALEVLQKAISINPNDTQAYVSIGNALSKLHKFDEALASYHRAIKLNPEHAEAYGSRGVLLHDLKRFDQALADCNKAIDLRPPDAAQAYRNRSLVLYDLKRFDEALADFGNAIALKPDYAEAYSDQGSALYELKRLDEALASYNKAIALKPDCAEAYGNRGVVLYDLKRLNEAFADYNNAIQLKPDYAEALWHKSLFLILMGQYAEGWKLYEYRFRYKDLEKNYYNLSQPSWRGENNIQGKRLLIYAEQGFGDVIQCCRYLPLLQNFGSEIIFEVQESLVPLVLTLNCNMNVVAKGESLPDFDAQCPIMSLPYAFKTTIETIPSHMPYLFSSETKTQVWRKKLGNKKNIRVGIAWSGSTTHKNDKNRSIKLNDLVSLTDLPIELHSLQKEYRQHDLDILNLYPQIYQHQDELDDFSDTAALIDCMDLVISVDTSVAHVAGAMGKTVWIMLPFVPDYRWMLDRDDSPWYPSAKLFRQPAIDDWSNVIREVENALLHLTAGS